jgi:hypothetical protein
MRTLKEDYVQMTAYENMEDTHGQIKEFIGEVYQKKKSAGNLALCLSNGV